jgi:hypothetical protein
MIGRRAALLGTAAAALVTGKTFAQSGSDGWPSRSVRVIVPYPAGGTADIAARLFFAAVSSRLGQPFVIENRSGATGTIGAGAAVQAAPDGYRSRGTSCRRSTPILSHRGRDCCLSPPFCVGQDGYANTACPLDVWAYHTQLDEVIALASALPDLPLVLDHAGGPLGAGPYAGQRDAVFADWSARMRRLAGARTSS